MKHRIHRFDIKMTSDQSKLEQFLNSLEGEVVAIIPNITLGLTAPNIDFLLIVEKVDEIDQLRPALERAVESGKPALIQVMVDQNANLAPPGLLEFGSMVYRAED